MKPGSKYYRLFEHLQRRNQKAVTLTFTEIEALIGVTHFLPQRQQGKTGGVIVIALVPCKLEPVSVRTITMMQNQRS